MAVSISSPISISHLPVYLIIDSDIQNCIFIQPIHTAIYSIVSFLKSSKFSIYFWPFYHITLFYCMAQINRTTSFLWKRQEFWNFIPQETFSILVDEFLSVLIPSNVKKSLGSLEWTQLISSTSQLVDLTVQWYAQRSPEFVHCRKKKYQQRWQTLHNIWKFYLGK